MLNIRLDKKTTFVTAIGVIAVAAFALTVIPLWNKARSVGSEVKALEHELISVRKVLQSRGKFRQTGALLTRPKTFLAIDEITKTGASHGINFLSISPQKITKTKDSRYPAFPIRMDLQSGYRDLGLFLGALERLKESITAVKSLQIEADPQVQSQIRTGLVIEVYLQEGEGG